MALPPSTSPNPRRRLPARPHVDLPSLEHCPTPLAEAASPSSLKKSATFHSPSSPSSSDDDPILSIPSLPRRSPTSIADRYIDRIIDDVNRSFSDLKGFASSDREETLAEPPPVPRFMINSSGPAPSAASGLPSFSPPATPQRPSARRHHASDSGIGSSVSSDSGGFKPVNAPRPASKEGQVRTGINGAAMNSHLQSTLSEYACKQIQKHIIVPILNEDKLQAFHRLVRGLPRRVASKEIQCLRDLEKVLLWLAPKWSVSKASFLLFCETSIQCIHTTVDYLNEREQTRPADRPYTNGYFVDLVEQVRHYASVMHAERVRSSQEEPEPNDENKIELVGGLSHTGRPAELAYHDGDRFVSLRTGEEVSAEDLKRGTKRAMDDVAEPDWSMARRRKSAGAAREEQTCSDCGKVFKRPCDLTKHEKTHSRPWKCSEPNCKYHEYGWPTEKERDRHVNDKHSASPPMYRCHFAPCPYESKRESNCKQHMEKAHGWTYVRSKNNGKTGRRATAVAASLGRTPPTPQTASPASGGYSAPTPEYSSMSPEQTRRVLQSPMITDSYMPDATTAPFDNLFGPSASLPWQDATAQYSPVIPTTSMPHGGHSLAWDPPQSSGVTAGLQRDDDTSLFGNDFNWSAATEHAGGLPTPLSHHVPFGTPATSLSIASHLDTFGGPYPPTTFAEPAPTGPPQPTSISPHGQADMTLCSPLSADGTDHLGADEGFDEFHATTRPAGDFSLYDATGPPASAPGPLFGDLSAFDAGTTQWTGRGTGLSQPFGMPDAMEE